jgi:hypothetical protein
MEYYIHSIRAVAVSPIVALAIITAAVPIAAQAAGQAPTTQPNDEERRKIGEANDLKLKAKDPLYAQQAKALAEQYRHTAEIVAQHGGDAQPILDAIAHLESQSDFISKARQSKHLSLEVPEVAPKLPNNGNKNK